MFKSILKLMLCAVAILLCLPAGRADAIVHNPRPQLVRVFSFYNAEATDQFLTSSQAEADWVVANNWGVETGDVFYIEPRAQESSTTALYRFYKWLPQREHFYTQDPLEAQEVPSYGYVPEGIVGYVYTSAVPGSVALRRFVRFDGSTGDLVHRYTIHAATANALIADGFYDEGVTGYVYESPYITVPNGLVFSARCEEGLEGLCDNTLPDHRDNYSNIFRTDTLPPRPAYAVALQMSFRLWSPDFFGSSDHLVFMPRARVAINQGALEQSLLHGISLAVGVSGSQGANPGCANNATTFIEQFWPAAGGSDVGWNSFNHTTQAACGAQLENGISYDFNIRVANDGLLTYTISVGGVALAQGSTRYDTTLGPAFDANAVGVWMTSAASADRDYTAFITEVSYQWESAASPPPDSKKRALPLDHPWQSGKALDAQDPTDPTDPGEDGGATGTGDPAANGNAKSGNEQSSGCSVPSAPSGSQGGAALALLGVGLLFASCRRSRGRHEHRVGASS